MQERQALRPLLVTLDELLETLASLEDLPARRAEDPALRKAIRKVRPGIAELLAVLDRMEGADDEARGSPLDAGGAAPPERMTS